MILLFTFIFSLHAQVYQRYCFKNPTIAQSAFQKLNFLKVNEDKIELDSNCIDLLISHHRTDLFQKFIQFRLPEAQIEFGTNAISKETCNILIEVEKDDGRNQNRISSSSPYLIHHQQNSNSSQQYSLLVSSGSSGSLEINQQKINIFCQKTNDWYEVKLNLAAGPITNSISLQNELLIQKQQRVQVGSFNQENQNQNHELSLSPNITLEKGHHSNLHYIFLKIK